jgi:hypothetical protein
MVRLFKCLLLVLFFMFPTMIVESMFCFKGILTSDKAYAIVFLKSVNSVDTIKLVKPLMYNVGM